MARVSRLASVRSSARATAAGFVAASGWNHNSLNSCGTRYNFNSSYDSYGGARCATPVHRGVAPLSSRGYFAPGRRANKSQECPKCLQPSRTVRYCTHDGCRGEACLACRTDRGWGTCDACGMTHCKGHLFEYSFETRECCGLHLLTADAYRLCTECAHYWQEYLPADEPEGDDEHGVMCCDHCRQETCRHARCCRSCGFITHMQAATDVARYSVRVPRIQEVVVEQLRDLPNTCLARDMIQSFQSMHEPPPEALQRRSGGRRTGSAKHARAMRPDGY